ncbi:MAG: RNA polymerase sigma factor [Mangrovibacterium sp.]
MNDQQLWHHIKEGNKLAFKQLHEKYFNQMCLYTLKSVEESGLVEDIVSDCFIKIWENRNKMEIKSSVKHYIFLMLRHLIIDFHRKKKFLTESIEKVPEPAQEEAFDELEQYAALYSALEQLPDQRRKILEMAIFDSMSYSEIAEKLKISKNTVKTQMGRAYRFLKENLSREDFYLFFFISRFSSSTDVSHVRQRSSKLDSALAQSKHSRPAKLN